ncbi:MAG: protein phosphatase 2C domain-containing protein [Planctomycetaceae bacterium]
MHDAKDTARALVRIGYDGSVHKQFRAAHARERFENEIRVLQYLEQRGCEFVPRVLGYDADTLELVTSNCGARIDHIGAEKLKSLFDELEAFGVRHDDPYMRNITYRASDGRFCIIDFEFATILDPAHADASPIAAAAAVAENLRLHWSGITDRGRFRQNNEDAFLTLAFNREDFVYLGRIGECPADEFDFVFAVSDGMGGERSGEFASRCAIDNITQLLPRRFRLATRHGSSGLFDCLHDLFQGIHWQLTTLGESYEDGHNMGATLSLVWYVAGSWYLGHIGDSRVYHLPKAGGIRQISEDHTHIGWLRRAGKLNEREARNHPRRSVLSQSLGAGNKTIRPQLAAVPAVPGDKLLLCTDGVIEGLWDRGLEELISSPSSEDAALPPADRIVRAAVAESGRDNASAVVIEIGGQAAAAL